DGEVSPIKTCGFKSRRLRVLSFLMPKRRPTLHEHPIGLDSFEQQPIETQQYHDRSGTQEREIEDDRSGRSIACQRIGSKSHRHPRTAEDHHQGSSGMFRDLLFKSNHASTVLWISPFGMPFVQCQGKSDFSKYEK